MHEWLKRLHLAVQNKIFSPGGIYDIRIEHDDNCAWLHANGSCNCNPRIILTFWGPGHNPVEDPPDDCFELNADGENIPLAGEN